MHKYSKRPRLKLNDSSCSWTRDGMLCPPSLRPILLLPLVQRAYSGDHPGYRPGFLPNKKLRGIAGARIFFRSDAIPITEPTVSQHWNRPMRLTLRASALFIVPVRKKTTIFSSFVTFLTQLQHYIILSYLICSGYISEI